MGVPFQNEPTNDGGRSADRGVRDAGVEVIGVMIVRDEAENLPDLFRSACGLVDAWVLLDTGSADATVETATRLGPEHAAPVDVVHQPWMDDFAHARNRSLEAAAELHPQARWFVVLDGDDRLVDPTRTRAFLDADPAADVLLWGRKRAPPSSRSSSRGSSAPRPPSGTDSRSTPFP
jgi:glycosyltransferase involved in cell wall biosynthesis